MIKNIRIFPLLFALLSLFICSPFGISAVNEHKEWIGQKVIFLPQNKGLQKYGYTDYSYVSDENDRCPRIPHEELAGKVATITDLKKIDYCYTIGEFALENGQKVYGKSLSYQFCKIGFLSEMDGAKQFIGKNVWNVAETEAENYDEQLDRYYKVPLKNLEPYTVVDVEWWWSECAPLWFVLKGKNGETVHWFGYYKNVTWSIPSCESIFVRWYLTDPRELHPDWSQKHWNQIKDFKVSIGMNEEMVLMSWGKPKKINKTITANTVSEQWVYSDDQYVYLDNGIVTALQTSE